MYCSNCGHELKENADFCINCGKKVDKPAQKNAVVEEEKPSAGWAVLCAFYPFIGLILYLVWMDSRPLRAKMCAKGAIIGVIIAAALVVLSIVVVIILVAVGVSIGAGYFDYGVICECIRCLI